jgi:D-amino-acid dehydrogenase
MSSADVTVIGGGVVGLAVAEALHRSDADVRVLERGLCGAEASAGNAGWITPGLSTPIPAPGVVPRALRWMLDPGSPLLIRPTLRPSFLRWSWEFCRSTARRRYHAGVAALVPLGRRALPAYDALRDVGVAFEMHADGLLFVAHHEAVLESELASLREQQALGFGGGVERLGAAETRALEPALSDAVVGGILAADERHVRPETVTAGLTEHLRNHAVQIREHVRVDRIERDGGGWAIHARGEVVRSERVVVAAGAQTGAMLAPLGVRLPLEGAKGYSVTDPAPPVRPRRPLYLLESKVGVSPYDGAVRLAGTLELGSRDTAVVERRLRALDVAGARYLDGWYATVGRKEWAGMRPLLPDGLPAIGPVPGHPGLFVATGHAMLGMTLAPVTAEVLAPVVLSDRAAPELAPFSVARFDGRAPSANGAAAREPARARSVTR